MRYAPETLICVHHEDLPAANTCYGDSGGPLIMDERGYGVVIGVSSFINGNSKCRSGDWKCHLELRCNKDGVAAYTKVDAYLPWIKKITKQGIVVCCD